MKTRVREKTSAHQSNELALRTHHRMVGYQILQVGGQEHLADPLSDLRIADNLS